MDSVIQPSNNRGLAGGVYRMDSRFVRSNGLLVLYITDFHFAILLILDFELISQVKGFQFVSLRSSRKLQVALATNQREKNKN